MGSSMSVLWTSQDDNTVDSTTGLTPKQKKIVQSTWNVARKDPVGSGVTVMIMFFKKHPDYQQVFSTFKDIPVDQLPDNKRFQAHCAYIITTLNSVIDSMHDFGLLEATLLSLGERHKNRGQTQQQFQHLREILVEFLSQRLGTDFTPEVADAWIKTLDLVYAGIFKAYA